MTDNKQIVKKNTNEPRILLIHLFKASVINKKKGRQHS